MVKNFAFCLLIVLMSCNQDQVEPVENIEGDLDYSDLTFELFLEGSKTSTLCNITRIDSSKNSYHIYFDKNACTGSIKRDGEIEVTLVRGNGWHEKDAAMKISYLDYEVEILAQQKNSPRNFFTKRTITGDQYIVNVTGGAMNDFLDGKIEYLERKTTAKNLTVKFNDNVLPQRYNEVSVKEFRREGDVTKLISRGDTTINGYNNVQEWGVDIYNQRFYRVIGEPIVKTLCNNGKRWKFTEGTKIMYSKDQYGRQQTMRKIFGVNENGEPDGTCASYGFKITTEKSDGQIQEKIYTY